jgi:hypothetical protein
MKKTLVTLATLAFATGAFAQGLVAFRNMMPGNPPAFVYLQDGVTKVPANSSLYYQAYAADLYYGAAGISDSTSLAPMGLTIYFCTAEWQAGLFSNQTAISIPGIASGCVATLQIRTWETQGGLYTSYAAARLAAAGLLGEGNLVQVTLTSPPAIPANMFGITPIVMHLPMASPVPEPTVAAIAGLGLASLLILRHKK